MKFLSSFVVLCIHLVQFKATTSETGNVTDSNTPAPTRSMKHCNHPWLFTVDTTDSMSPFIDNIKNTIIALINPYVDASWEPESYTLSTIHETDTISSINYDTETQRSNFTSVIQSINININNNNHNYTINCSESTLSLVLSSIQVTPNKDSRDIFLS